MSGLSLLNPRGLLLAAGVIPLVLLYILKIRRRHQLVSSTWLWAAAQRDLVAKHPFRKLVPEVPLLLELLALVALAIVLARPSSMGGGMDGDHVVIVVDASASMATRVGGPAGATTRMDEAKRAARELVLRLGPGSDAMVIEASRDARIVSPFERDPRRLEAALATLDAREVEGDLTSAVALAAERLRSLGGHTRLVIVTDGALAHDEPLSVTNVPTDVITVGDAEDNAGIVRVDVRSGVDATSHREQVQVFAMIESWAPRSREAYMTLTVEGRTDPVASRRLLLAALDKQPVVMTFEPRPDDRGQGLVVQLSPGDAEPVDDVAFARVPAATRMPVVVASGTAYSWTTRALEADPGVDLRRMAVSDLGSVNVDPDSLVVIEGACPPVVPGGDVLVVAPPAGLCLGLPVGAEVADPTVTSWTSADPRLRFLTLDGVHVTHAFALEPRGAGASLVRSSSATLVADASMPGRTATVVGFDVGDSDWPLKASFVLFVRNVVELARAHRAQGADGPVHTGDPARFAAPPGTPRVIVSGPGLPEREIATRDAIATLPSLEHAGLFHARWTEPHVGSSVVAVNLTSASESDVRPRPVRLAGGAARAGADAPTALDSRADWVRWIALVAALALAFDVFWVTRQPRPRSALP